MNPSKRRSFFSAWLLHVRMASRGTNLTSRSAGTPWVDRTRMTRRDRCYRGQVVALALAFAASHTAVAQPVPDLEQQVDRLFGSLPEGSPGAAVLVSQDGKILLSKGYGLANVAALHPVTPATRFRIGSITKQFTAAAILKLHEQGRLNLEDHLSKFIPSWPRGAEITVLHLLHHTSGIHDYTQKPNFSENAPTHIALEDLIRSFQHDSADFEPGEQFRYNNSGYALLKQIVEKVSGASYETYLRTTFFEPLGLKHTGVYPLEPQGPDDAVGYAFESGAIRRAKNWDPSRLAGAGELCSTVGDLFLWNEALFGGKILSTESLRTAFAVGLVKGDDPTHLEETGYGCGWIIDSLRGEREIGHGGELAGFGSYLLRLPGRRLTVVVLLNCVPQMPTLHQWNLARDVAARAATLPPATTSKFFADIKDADLQAIVGRYEMGHEMALHVTREDRRVFFEITGRPRTEIFPISDRRFVVAGGAAEANFVRDANGQVVKAILKQGGARIDAPKSK